MFNLLCLILPNSINSFLHIDCVFWGNVFIRDWIIQTRRGHISKRKFREMNQHFCLVCWSVSVWQRHSSKHGGGSVGMGACTFSSPFCCVKQSLVCGGMNGQASITCPWLCFCIGYLLDTTYWPGHWAQEKL